MKLTGISAFKGVVFGKALLYSSYCPWENEFAADQLTVPEEKISSYEEALDRADAEFGQWICSYSKGDKQAGIIEAQRELLRDVAMDEMIRAELAGEVCVSQAVKRVYDQMAESLSCAENQFTRERVSDLRDVCSRLLRCLAGVEEKNLSRLPEPVIVVARELYPSDTASIDRENVRAIVTEQGGLTSHTAILARDYKIPTILGVKDAAGLVKDGDWVAVDAAEGHFYLNPTEEEASLCRRSEERNKAAVASAEAYLGAEAVTQDGVRIRIGLNIADAASVKEKAAESSDGVGLMRSEFLFMESSSLPDENTQVKRYGEALRKFDGKPVVLRTLDVGGDKRLDCLETPREENPFLGKRGLRLCLDERELFMTQLRAALRASALGDLRIMFPMVGSMEDWRCAKSLTEQAMEQLKAEGIPYNSKIKLGIMIEVPSIAVLSDWAAREVDFASIGTNDLCQYLMAADRMNPEVAAYYKTFHPAMLRVLRYIALAFEKEKKPLCVCGEMAGDPRGALALIGLGFRELSMNASGMAEIKRLVNSISIQRAGELAEAACIMDSAGAAESLLTGEIKRLFNEM